MKYKINKRILEQYISKVSRLALKHITLPVLSCIYMEVVNKSKLTLRATNLDVAIEVVLKVENGEDGVIAIPSDVFQSTINVFKGEGFIAESLDGNLKIKSDKNTATIKCLPHDDFPSIPKLEDGIEFQIKSKDILLGLRSVVYAASQSSIKPELSSVYIYNDSGVMVFVSTDSFRLAEKRVHLPKDVEFDSIVVPYKNAMEIIKIFEGLDENLLIKINKNQLSISNGDITVVSRLIDGVFPDYKQIIPKFFVSEVGVLKTDLLNSIKASSVFSDTLHQVKFKITKKSLLVESKNSDVGEYKEEVESKVSGDDLELNFNSKYVADCFQSVSSESLSLSFAGAGKPLLIKGSSDNSFIYIVMPMNR